jgi:hypothetical protein
MRSPFVWWCKRQCKSFAHQFKTDWQFRTAAIVLLIEVAALAYFAANSFLLSKLLG